MMPGFFLRIQISSRYTPLRYSDMDPDVVGRGVLCEHGRTENPWRSRGILSFEAAFSDQDDCLTSGTEKWSCDFERAEGCLDEAVKDDWNWDSIRFRSKLALGENSKVWRLRYSGCWWRMERVFRACRMIPSSRLSNICMIGLWLSKDWLTLSSTKLEWR